MTENIKELAQKEFDVILDLLSVPLKQDFANEELPGRRRWKGVCISAGLPAELPDLVPVNPSPGKGIEGFCKLSDKGFLVVTIKNQGKGTAPPSTTRVIFANNKTFDIPTPQIQAGKSVDLTVEGVGRLSGISCQFVVIANAKFEIPESDMSNNTVLGLCNPTPIVK